MSRQTILALVTPLLITASACKEDVKADEVRSRTQASIEANVESSTRALETLATLETLDSVFASLATLQQSFAGTPIAPDDSTPLPAPAPLSRLERAAVRALTATVDGAADGEGSKAQPIIDWLNEYVFADGNMESVDGDTAVFTVSPEGFCTSEVCSDYDCDLEGECVPAEGAECEEVVNHECVSTLADFELRVRATIVDDTGVDLEILVGPDEAAPVLFELRDDSAAVEVDLAAIKAAVVHILDVADQQADLPEVFTGRVRLELVVNGEQNISLAASVLQAIAIEGDTPEGPVAFRIDAAVPLATVTVDGLASSISGALAAGALDLIAPWSSSTIAPSGSSLGIHVDGASLALTLAGGATDLLIEDIGFGDASSTIKKDDVTLFSFDLNAASGRLFDLLVTPDAASNSATFTVTPELDLSFTFNLQAVADELGEVEPYLLDETYRITLTGDGSAAVQPVAGDGVDFDGGLEVISGSLTISSTSSTTPVVVEAGQCLVGYDVAAEGAHPLLGYFGAASCE